MAVLSHEGAEHLHYRWMIPSGVSGDALQGVDPAQPHVELVGAELLDGLGIYRSVIWP
jgi:hypothetical protein